MLYGGSEYGFRVMTSRSANTSNANNSRNVNSSGGNNNNNANNANYYAPDFLFNIHAARC